MNLLNKLDNLLYKLIRWWEKPNWVKPRYLGNKYVDTDTLLHHSIMEIMCQFVEQELHFLDEYSLNKDERQKYSSILDHYSWWALYNKTDLSEFYPRYTPGPRHGEITECGGRIFNMISEDENLSEWVNICSLSQEQELIDRCVEIVKLSPYMWT